MSAELGAVITAREEWIVIEETGLQVTCYESNGEYDILLERTDGNYDILLIASGATKERAIAEAGLILAKAITTLGEL